MAFGFMVSVLCLFGGWYSRSGLGALIYWVPNGLYENQMVIINRPSKLALRDSKISHIQPVDLTVLTLARTGCMHAQLKIITC